ncbi:hypothetical protein JCM10003_3685 [Bacteroides pyogenes JCM 10003]|nr:hypothetical protein JCM10003_3685 [Bacteroides pyogenes JCM 10003]
MPLRLFSASQNLPDSKHSLQKNESDARQNTFFSTNLDWFFIRQSLFFHIFAARNSFKIRIDERNCYNIRIDNNAEQISFDRLSACSMLHTKAQIPTVNLKDIDGKSINTGKVSNDGKPLIISFFATWCKPCLRELNAINEVYEEWQEDTGVKLIAVSIDEGANSFKVKPLARTQGWTFSVWLDSNKDFMRAMNVNMVPSVFVLDGKGNIAYRHTGYVEGGEAELIRQVKATIR